MEIPTIDLSNPNIEEIVDQLRKACIEVGFFYLTGYDHVVVDQQNYTYNNTNIIDEEQVLQCTKSFFQLSLSSKQSLCDPILSRGYTAMEEETLDPTLQNQQRGDTKEGFYIGIDIPLNDPRYNPQKLRGPNQWPNPSRTPDMDVEQCRLFQSTMQRYFHSMCQIGFHVVQLIAMSVGLDKNYFDSYFLQEPMAALRLLHYAPTVSQPEQGIYGAGAHSDYGMITLLLTDDVPGLQILINSVSPDDNEQQQQPIWIDIPPKKKTFIVNLGDMLERWTNGLYKSTIHRVILRDNQDRYSIPFFYEPNFDTKVIVLDVCCTNNETTTSNHQHTKYPPITSGEYLLSKYKATHADFQPINTTRGAVIS